MELLDRRRPDWQLEISVRIAIQENAGEMMGIFDSLYSFTAYHDHVTAITCCATLTQQRLDCLVRSFLSSNIVVLMSQSTC